MVQTHVVKYTYKQNIERCINSKENNNHYNQENEGKMCTTEITTLFGDVGKSLMWHRRNQNQMVNKKKKACNLDVEKCS